MIEGSISPSCRFANQFDRIESSGPIALPRLRGKAIVGRRTIGAPVGAG
jgi:hypothetical protein